MSFDCIIQSIDRSLDQLILVCTRVCCTPDTQEQSNIRLDGSENSFDIRWRIARTYCEQPSRCEVARARQSSGSSVFAHPVSLRNEDDRLDIFVGTAVAELNPFLPGRVGPAQLRALSATRSVDRSLTDINAWR